MNALNLRTLVACSTLFCLSLIAAPARAEVVYLDDYSYAAVAYSTSTGEFGYAYNYYSLAEAKREALSTCPADDAEIVGWVQGGFLVLAIGEDNSYGIGWEYGDGASTRAAAATARANCESHDTRVVKMVYVTSGDITPQIISVGE
jgi:hypothetical protein